jgi:hypothetical protein
MTTELNKQLHALLTQTGLASAKCYLVESFTHGRSQSSKDLTNVEAIEFIKYLKMQLNKQKMQAADDANHISKSMPSIKASTPFEQANTMRKKIIALAHQMGWSAIHPSSGNKIADMPRINNWCVQYGYLHKELNAYTLEELPKLVTQYQNLYNSFLKGF